MMRVVEELDKEKISGIVSVIPDDKDRIEFLGAIDLYYLEHLIKEIKKRDPCKRGNIREYKIGFRINADNDGIPNNHIGRILLFQKNENLIGFDPRSSEEKNLYYAIAPIIIEREEETKRRVEKNDD